MMVCRGTGANRMGLAMNDGKLDRKIVRKKSIPAQIVLWVVMIGLLYAFWKAFSGHMGH